MQAHRQKVPDGSGTANAPNYSLKRWEALTRYLNDGAVPIDNNWMKNQIWPSALERSNWLYTGSLRSGQRTATVMTLIQSAKLNGHDPYAYLKDVLPHLPTQKNSAINELLPHNWKPATSDKVWMGEHGLIGLNFGLNPLPQNYPPYYAPNVAQDLISTISIDN